ncbi:uncharacterized protein LOC120712545 [Panicum virgatum]|uniref:F-box domain-containing protein n=1 Tax=Panicum virgatum TaxID=38727 RepID=A0A8T0RE85_PANVG|nr:uncharacterized protein LOC120712545 [Panicum virgatum]KAG2584312.1 hypothetical protein PVAP13_6KG300300 [Panicum virgatum]
MAPPPPPLPDDVIPDILLRVRPDDPASLVRASVVCKFWRRALADPSFAARYRVLHPGAPPVLGFLYRPEDLQVTRFAPTSSFRVADRPMGHPLDCRHGRAVLYDYDIRVQGFVVWDPATGAQCDAPGRHVPDVFTNVAVLCAGAEGCDHRACARGPFIVAFVGVENPEKYYLDAHASFYSSDTGEWSVHINVHLNYDRYDLVQDRQAALVGEALYFVGEDRSLLRFRYGIQRRLPGIAFLTAGYTSDHILSVIEPPPGGKLLGDVVAMEAEGGGLGLASLSRGRLSLWARDAGHAGDDAAGWVLRRAIDLGAVLPVGVKPKKRLRGAHLCGIAHEAGVIFVSTKDGVFTVKLGSPLQGRKVSDVANLKHVFPFESFYTEAFLLKMASGR